MHDQLGLAYLPYDILSVIFKAVDRSTLVSVCLSSRRYNEIASEDLYRSLLFVIDQGISDNKDPLPAIMRRPSLMSAVHTTSFKVEAEDWGPQHARRLNYIARCLQGIPSIRKVEWIQSPTQWFSHLTSIEYFMAIVSILPSVEELSLPPIGLEPLVPTSYNSTSLRHLTLRRVYPAFSDTAWYQSVVSRLQSLTILNHRQEIDLLRGASALRTLKLESVRFLADFCSILDDLPLLECISLVISSKHFQVVTDFCPYTLPKLERLELRLTGRPTPARSIILESLRVFIQSLTSATSSLSTLRLSSQVNIPEPSFGESLAAFVIEQHRNSLRVLDLDSLALKEETAASVLKQCLLLEEIGFLWRCPDIMPHSIWGLLGLRPTLTTLHLTIEHMKDARVMAIMSQSPLPLQKVFLCTMNPRKYAVWESQTYYDPELRRLQRKVISKRISPEEWETYLWR